MTLRCPALALTLMLLFSLSMPALAATTALVSTPQLADQLHLRAAPEDAADSLGAYYNGTSVTILDDKDPYWARVRIGVPPGSAEGYMRKSFLTKGSDKGSSAMPEYISTASTWELMDQPSDTASSRTQGQGEAFLLMGLGSGWWHVISRDLQLSGYVRAGSLQRPSSAVIRSASPEGSAHLRAEPDKSAASLGQYYTGVRVTFLGYCQDKPWASVRIGPLEGYMDAACLVTDVTEMKKVQSAMPSVTVTGDGALRLRDAPASDGGILGVYAVGLEATVLGFTDKWSHVEIMGQTGFMMSQYLTPRFK